MNHYKNAHFLEVTEAPKINMLFRSKGYYDNVVGIGGGSVIDTAKIIARKNTCIVYPTTASGAASTPFATVWDKSKMSIETKMPLLRSYPWKINLPKKVLKSTIFDCLAHIKESFLSKNKSEESIVYSRAAFGYFLDYMRTKDIKLLITAGNIAGHAISMTGTNIIHALSYPLTIEYGIDHGTACGIIIPGVMKFYFGVSQVPNIKYPKAKFDLNLVAEKALEYGKIQTGLKKVTKKDLIWILRRCLKKSR